MTIYLDIVFLENFLLNYIIVLSTAIMSKEKINIIRISVSSIIGGIFAIIGYMLQVSFFYNVIIKIAISILMMKIAFSQNKFKKFIKNIIFFYFISFTYGGIAFMLLFFINPQNIVIDKNRFVGMYPLKITSLAGVTGFIIIAIVSKLIKNKITKKSMICDLEIFYNGNFKKIKTMLDTGNLLKEPISQSDVIVVERDSLREIMSDEILENINTIIKGEWLEAENIHSFKLKIIPFSSLGNDNGLLIGFKPDYIKIYSDEEIIRDDVIIGIYDGRLSKSNMYTSLIGLDILKMNA